MTYFINITLLLLLIVTAASATFLVKELMSSVFILGSYSFFLGLVWAWLGAVDVAFVEAVIGAGLATVLFLVTLFDTAPKDSRLRRPPPPLAGVLGLPMLGILLLFAANDLPSLGDPTSPANVHISPYYLQQSYADTLTPNVVTSVLMDYRGFDTLIETVVIFTAGIACSLLLKETRS
jgi:multicomponent Na+:H+ antiporter subunit B